MSNNFTTKKLVTDKDDKGVSSFIRSKQDNTLFKSIQVKDLKPLLTDDCVNFIDGDGFAFKVSSSVEEDYVEVTHKETKEVSKYSNISEWKGRSRKEGVISVDSVLGRENIKREAKGLPEYKIEDFIVEKKKRLKFENGTTIDGIKFDNTFEVAKYFLSQWIEAVKIQTQVPNILITLGSGKCHRNFLDTPKEYKSNRTGERPLLLTDVRNHILEEYPSDEAPEGYETDEICDMRAFEHYLKYRKTNLVSGIKTSPDKDARCTAGFLFDPTKTFHFNQPQVWLIEASDRSVGELELVKSGMKFTSLMGTAYQMVISDNSDFYGSRLTMPPEMKPDIKYGDAAFYKDFINLKSPEEVLQKVVNVFLMFYPEGVRFRSHLGNEIHEDTLWWCQQCFACQYMLRKLNDPTKLVDLLNRYKVDYSKLVNNHVPPTHNLVEGQTIRDNLETIKKEISSIMEVASDKSGKVADKNARFDEIKDLLGNMKENLDNFYDKEHTVQVQNKVPKRSLQDFLDEDNKKNGYESTPEGDYESLTECLGVMVHSEITDSHRWYDDEEITYKVVIDGEDRFFKTFGYHITGDNSARDMDLPMPTIKDVYEVYSKQIKTFVYE